MLPVARSLCIAAALVPSAAFAGAGPGPDHTAVPGSPVSAPWPGRVDYLIVTDAALATSFEPLVVEKQSRGLTVHVRTLDEIEHAAPGGDLPERIRRYIAALHERSGLRWVLLGGDLDIVPSRLIRRMDDPEFSRLAASDLYYVCLDGDWDGNGDGFFGDVNEDDADLTAELAIGRAPVRTAEEADAFVAKTLAYRALRDEAFRDRVLLLAEGADPAYTWPLWSAETWTQGVFDSSAASIETVRLYGVTAGYPGSETLSRDAALAQLTGTAHGTVLQLGDAACETIGLMDADLSPADADALTNIAPFVFGSVHATSTVEGDCVAEHLMRHPTGGAVASLGQSGVNFSVPARDALGAWLRHVFREESPSAGEAQVAALNALQPPVARWGATWILLGDPELDVGPRFPIASAPRPVRQDMPLLLVDLIRPNPVHATAEIALSLATPARVVVTLHDVLGRRVARIAERHLAPGRHTIGWDGRGAGGHPVPAGVYFVRVEAGGTTVARSLTALPGH